MSKIKVVQVITRLIKGGAQKVCLDITQGLPKDRYEVFLLSGPETGLEGSLWDKAGRIQGVRIKVIPELVREISPIKDLLALLRLYCFFCKTRPDIVHCHTSKAGFIGCLAGWLARVPVIIYAPYGHLFSPSAQIPSVSNNNLKLKLFYLLTKLTNFLSTVIIAQNDADKDDQVKLRLDRAIKYKVIHNSVEIHAQTEYSLTPKHNSDFSRTLGNPVQDAAPRYPVLATVGRLSPEKGQIYLLEAMKSVRNIFPNALLLMIGDGTLRDQLENFVKSENIGHNIKFLGLCNEPSQLLKDIDIFILPSLYESFGIVLLEAMAQKKPTIASNVNGIPGVVVHNQTGILVPPANPQALSEAIIKLARDKELARKMGLAGYERADKLFRQEQMVDNFDNLYRKLYRPISEVIHDSAASIKSPHPPFAKGEKGGLEITNQEGFIIEPANKSDIPILAAMHIDPSIDKVQEIIQRHSGAYKFYLDKVNMFQAIEPDGVLVAREGNRITGFIIATKDSSGMMKLALKKWFILRLTLKSLFFRYGINKEMLKKLFMVPYSVVHRSEVPLERRTAMIRAFIAMKESRNKGLGVKLINAACDDAHQQNNNAISVTVAKDNLPALNLYQKAGFNICGECLESTGPSHYLTKTLKDYRQDCHPELGSGSIGILKQVQNDSFGEHKISSYAIKHANRAVYNAKTVAQYEQNPSIFEPARQARIKNIINFISAKTSGKTFLDIGCGTGNVLRIARQHFGLALGVDIAEKFLKEVKKLHPELDLIAADSNRLPFKDKAFDCISLYGTLHHLFNPAQTLAGISSLLKPAGYLYTDHDPNYFFSRFYHLYYRLKHRQPGFGSKQEELAEFHNTQTGGINPESLKQKLLNSGFQDVQVNYRHTTNPSLPLLARLCLLLLKASARLTPLKSFYTHFYIIGRR